MISLAHEAVLTAQPPAVWTSGTQASPRIETTPSMLYVCTSGTAAVSWVAPGLSFIHIIYICDFIISLVFLILPVFLIQIFHARVQIPPFALIVVFILDRHALQNSFALLRFGRASVLYP